MLEVPTQARSKREIAQDVFDYYKASEHEDDVSQSRAGRIADKIIRGTFKPNPGLARAIGYADKTGENAVHNVMNPQAPHRYF